MVSLEVVRVVRVADASFIIKVPKDDGNRIMKGIRHAMDSSSHGDVENRIQYVYDDYEFKVNSKDDYLEVIVTQMDLVVHINKFIPDTNVASTVRAVLSKSSNMICVGNFEINEHYTMEIEVSSSPEEN